MRVPAEVFVTLICTLRKRHRGNHYDEVFSRGWVRK